MDVQSVSDALAAAVESAGASVVRVEGRCVAASGVVWSADGVVVTASHAIGRGEGLAVGLPDGRVVKATVAGRDAGTDVAVLRVEATGLTAPRWSDGVGLKVGHLVLPVGRPGRSVRATLGMLGALGDGFRSAGGAQIDRYLEVDGSLPRGFSGGPLVDTAGAFLGMNTAALTRAGGTVPYATLRRVADELVANGRVGRAYLGVSVFPTRVPESLREKAGAARGLVVVGLDEAAPAARDGLLVGDVIVSVGGAAVEGPGDLLAALEGRVGAAVSVKVIRAGEVAEVTVTAGARS